MFDLLLCFVFILNGMFSFDALWFWGQRFICFWLELIVWSDIFCFICIGFMFWALMLGDCFGCFFCCVGMFVMNILCWIVILTLWVGFYCFGLLPLICLRLLGIWQWFMSDLRLVVAFSDCLFCVSLRWFEVSVVCKVICLLLRLIVVDGLLNYAECLCSICCFLIVDSLLLLCLCGSCLVLLDYFGLACLLLACCIGCKGCFSVICLGGIDLCFIYWLRFDQF